MIEALGLLIIFILLKILQYLDIIYKLWILDIVRGLFGVLFNFRINYVY